MCIEQCVVQPSATHHCCRGARRAAEPLSTLSFPGKNTLSIWERLSVPGERLNIRFVLCFCNSRSQISSESPEPHSFKINEKDQVWKISAGKRLGFEKVIEGSSYWQQPAGHAWFWALLVLKLMEWGITPRQINKNFSKWHETFWVGDLKASSFFLPSISVLLEIRFALLCPCLWLHAYSRYIIAINKKHVLTNGWQAVLIRDVSIVYLMSGWWMGCGHAMGGNISGSLTQK